MAERVILSGLQTGEYSHPLDREARKALEAVPGLSVLVKKLNEVGFDRILHLESMANKIRVTNRQFPHLYRLFREMQEVLDIRREVDLYITQAFSLNAYAAGVEYPHVTVTTELVNQFSDAELQFVFAHELGHIKSEHMLYHQIGMFLPRIIDLVGAATLGLGRLVGTGLEVALYDWIRKSEFTADRAGLLGCQNPEAVKTAFSKLVGVPAKWLSSLDLGEIQGQADDFASLVKEDGANRFLSYFGQMWNTHPWLIIRMEDLADWFETGDYARTLYKRYQARGHY